MEKIRGAPGLPRSGLNINNNDLINFSYTALHLHTLMMIPITAWHNDILYKGFYWILFVFNLFSYSFETLQYNLCI